jgi:hypothetical protein
MKATIMRRRYPDFLLIGWERTDGDFECLAALNGDQIEPDDRWNAMVEWIVAAFRLTMPDHEIVIVAREELVSVLAAADDAPLEPVPIRPLS